MTTPTRRVSGIYDRRKALVIDVVPPPPPPPLPPPPPVPTLPVPPSGLVFLPAFPNALIPAQADGIIPVTPATTPPWSAKWNTAGNVTYDFVRQVVHVNYPKGFKDGSAPGTLYIDKGGVTRHWMQFAYQWNPGFEQDPAGMTKTHYAITQSGGNFAFEIYGVQGGPYTLDCVLEVGSMSVPNAKYGGTTQRISSAPGALNVPFDPSVLHTITTLVDYHAQVIQGWVDNTLVLSSPTLTFPTNDPIGETEIYPGWGGNTGALKSQQDCAEFSKIILAVA